MEEARLKSRARRGKYEEKKCDPAIPTGIDPDDVLPEEPEEMRLWKKVVTKKVAPTLDELHEEMRREAAEIRLTRRVRRVHQMQANKKAEADGFAHVADAAKFALQQVGSDEDMPMLLEHWRSQIKKHTVLMNEATSPLDCYITLTDEELDLIRLDSIIHESIYLSKV